jgi:hypothetical protein
MICRSKQLFIVIDPMYSNLGWEYDLEGVIEQHLQHRKAIKQTIQTVIGQQTIKDLFYNIFILLLSKYYYYLSLLDFERVN